MSAVAENMAVLVHPDGTRLLVPGDYAREYCRGNPGAAVIELDLYDADGEGQLLLWDEAGREAAA